MGSCVEKLPCPDCGSSDSRQVFYNDEEDTFSSYCFSKCNAQKGSPYTKDKPRPEILDKTAEQIFQEVQEIKKLPLMHKAIRGIPKKYLEDWRVRYSVSEYDGKTPWAVYFGYQDGNKLVRWKGRGISKKVFWGVGAARGVDPFGYTRALKNRAKRLYICEGEYDAIALDYALTKNAAGGKYADMKYSIISLPHGTSSIVDTLKRIIGRCKTVFKEIVLVMDNDEAGKKAEKEAQKLLPGVLRADMPIGCSDPNDAVEKGMIDELVNCVKWGAHKPPIKGVIQVSEVMSRVIKDPGMGLSYPYQQLNDLTLGQRFSECVGIGAGVSIGKTTLAHECGAHNITEHGEPCFMVLLEEQNHMTVRNVAGKIDSQPYHLPKEKASYDKDQLIETANSLQGKLLLWESDEDQEMRFDMDSIITAIRFNTLEYGCRFHYIDNLTRLVDHLSSSEANEFINKYSSILEGLCTQLDIHIDVFSHLNNPKKGQLHENGGKVELYQFTGSRGLMRSFPMLLGFERNKSADESHVNNSYLRVLKNRKYGGEGKLKLKYDPATGRLLENEWQGGALYEESF